MQFTLPTTKAQMYTTLKQIFYFYRVKRETPDELILEELNLERLSYTALTEGQLLEKAQSLTRAEQMKRVLEVQNKITAEIAEVDDEISGIQSRLAEVNAKINDGYAKAILKAQREAAKKGLVNSNSVVNKIADLEAKRAQELSRALSEHQARLGELTSKKASLQDGLSGLDDVYAPIEQKEIVAKKLELIDEQDELIREIFKYNNGLEEKEVRYRNLIKQTQANINVKYAQVKKEELSKDTLIEMGYYDDVIDCVCGYYDRLGAQEAWADIQNESKICLYLEEFYSDVVYMYRMRASS